MPLDHTHSQRQTGDAYEMVNTKHSGERRYLTLREAAEWYGLSERTLRRRIAEGKLRAFRVGPRSIRVSVDDLDKLAHAIPTAG